MVLLTKDQANAIAKAGDAEINKRAVEKFSTEVRKAATRGEFQCWVTDTDQVLKVVYKLATENGYKAELLYSQRDGDSCHIDWS